MSKAKKQAAPTEMDDDSTDSESSVDADDDMVYQGNEEVNVDFEGRSPMDPDCHGISQLLQRVFLKAHVNCMQLADLIIGQNYVGSVICQCEPSDDDSEADDDMCDDGTIFGVTTVVNLNAKKDMECVEQLRTFILQNAEKHATDAALKHFREVLSNDKQSVGYLVNERFINIPPQISVPLLENLYKEILAAKKKNMPFDFEYFLMIMKLYRKEAKRAKPAEDTYTNAEEEEICKQSANSFEFSVAKECDTGISGHWLEDDATLTPYRKVVLFNAKQLPEIILNIKNLTNSQ